MEVHVTPASLATLDDGDTVLDFYIGSYTTIYANLIPPEHCCIVQLNEHSGLAYRYIQEHLDSVRSLKLHFFNTFFPQETD